MLAPSIVTIFPSELGPSITFEKLKTKQNKTKKHIKDFSQITTGNSSFRNSLMNFESIIECLFYFRRKSLRQKRRTWEGNVHQWCNPEQATCVGDELDPTGSCF